MVAGGNADLAILPVSEILHAAAIDFAGRIALEIQFRAGGFQPPSWWALERSKLLNG
jgi:hypothetical protein